MTTILGHKIRLWPTPRQEEYFRKACGTARFAYNWGLDEWRSQYAAGKKPSAYALKKQFNGIKKIQYPWAMEVTKCAAEQSFIDLQGAYQKFFKKLSKYPRFKKRGLHDQFYLSNQHFAVNGNRLRIPKLGCFVYLNPLGKHLIADASMTLLRGYKLQPTMTMLQVVPANET